METCDSRQRDEIAVIGMAGRFPMADNLEVFWENLKRGRNCIGKLPGPRVKDLSPFFGEAVKSLPDFGYLNEISQFDPQFFGISPGEAPYIDPAQRLLLEVVYQAMEYGGYGGKRLVSTNTGVFIAYGSSDYRKYISYRDFTKMAEVNNLPAVTAGRISHLFDLRGPALLIDTACSSSLAALHYACQAIKHGECDMAVVGAVNIRAYSDWIDVRLEAPGEPLPADDAGESKCCRVFDNAADGVINGEGVAALLLKPLTRALKEGDVICAVVKGSAINQNGSRTPTISGLKPESQAELLSQALENAQIKPETLSYIEASGAATKMGDPIEIKSITDLFAAHTTQKQFCALGSVKANIGHLNQASGLAGVTKVILALQHKQIPPLAHFNEPNEYIDFKNSPVYVPTQLKEWELGKGDHKIRRAGISSFSVNGTNCHIIMEETPTSSTLSALQPSTSYPDRYNIFSLSAKTPTTLETLCHLFKEYLKKDTTAAFDSICYTMNTGRGHHEYRLALVCQNRTALGAELDNLDFSSLKTKSSETKPMSSKAVFLFSGSGKNLGKVDVDCCWDFYRKGFIAARYMDECGAFFKLEKYPRILVFAFQYALARLWMDMGIKPAFVLGFGIGKWVSRVISGKLELKEALEICISENDAEASFNEDKFRQNIERLYSQGQRLFLEIGPENELGTKAANLLHREPGIQVLCSYGWEDLERTLLKNIALLYTQGASLDFSPLFYSPKTVLPTYPFNHQPYWIKRDSLAGQLKTLSEVSQPQLKGKKTDIGDWFYIPTWKPAALSFPGPENRKVAEKACWLIFVDECGLGPQLVKQLQQDNQEVITVKSSEAFQRVNPREYLVNPGNDRDYITLVKELRKTGRKPEKILHLWSVTRWEESTDPDRIMNLGFNSLLYFVQAVGKQVLSGEPIQMMVVSTNTQKVSGEENLCPEKAALIGAVRGIPREYPNINLRSLDLVLPPPGSKKMTLLVQQLLTEFSLEGSERVAAYRGEYRWIQTFEPIKLAAPDKAKSRLREKGVYLITGGLGGIGLVLAQYLAKSIQAKLILTTRSGFPEPGEYDQWLKTHAAAVEDPVSGKIKKIREMEKAGARVLVCQADVTQPQQMQTVINLARERLGTINGVIHSAGVLDSAVIPLRNRETTGQVLAPKVEGTRVLARIMAGIKPDFFIMCSCISGILGALGQLENCAANAFQDAFALDNRSRNGTYTVSINWDDWQEVGMAVISLSRFKENKGTAVVSTVLQHGILPAEGQAVFSRILGANYPHVVVSTRDLFPRLEQFHPPGADDPQEEIESSLETFTTQLTPRPELSTEYVPPKSQFEKDTADIMQKFSGLEKIGVNDNFFEVGIDSLNLLHINRILKRRIKKEIPIIVMFEYPTIRLLEKFLNQQEEEADEYDLNKGVDLLHQSMDILLNARNEDN